MTSSKNGEEDSNNSSSIFAEVLSASIGGMLSASALYPLEVIKTKLQAANSSTTTSTGSRADDDNEGGETTRENSSYKTTLQNDMHRGLEVESWDFFCFVFSSVADPTPKQMMRQPKIRLLLLVPGVLPNICIALRVYRPFIMELEHLLYNLELKRLCISLLIRCLKIYIILHTRVVLVVAAMMLSCPPQQIYCLDVRLNGHIYQ